MGRYKVIELRDCKPIARYSGGSEEQAYKIFEKFAASQNPVEMIYIEQQASNPAMKNLTAGIKALVVEQS